MRLVYVQDCVTATLQGRCDAALFERIESALDRTLSFYEPGYRFAPEYKRGIWDGKRHLLKQPKTTGLLTFPAGLGGRVLTTLRDELDLDIDVIDERSLWPHGVNLVKQSIPLLAARDKNGRVTSIQLYDDQQLALRAFLKEPRGCLSLPTS